MPCNQPVPSVAEGKLRRIHRQEQLQLPFNDEWLVYQGGRNLFDNGYAVNDDTRFAMDFVYLKDGQMFSGKGGIGSKAQDYYCFGQPDRFARGWQGYQGGRSATTTILRASRPAILRTATLSPSSRSGEDAETAVSLIT